jgi:hypothetical protein
MLRIEFTPVVIFHTHRYQIFELIYVTLCCFTVYKNKTERKLQMFFKVVCHIKSQGPIIYDANADPTSVFRTNVTLI